MRNDAETFGYANLVAARLTGKFDLSNSLKDRDGFFPLWRHLFTVMPGRKYHRIVHQSSIGIESDVTTAQRMSFCFVDDDGNVYKSGSWASPAKGVRFNVSTQEGLEEFVLAADQYTSFLYAGRKAA